MKRKKSDILILLTVFIFSSFQSCSNFLIDPRIAPDSEPVPSALSAVISATISVGKESTYGVSVVTIDWSEEVPDVSISDLEPLNCTVGGFSHSGDTSSFSLTAVSSGTVGFSISAGAITGISGLKNTEENYLFIYSPVGLTLSISSTEPSITSLTPIPLTFHFSESVTGFEITDISTTLGSVENLSGSGYLYSADLVPGTDGTAEIAVVQGAAADTLTGASESQNAVFSITYDGTSPGVILTGPVSDGGIAGYNTLTFTASFSEPVTGFTLDDISALNADLANLGGSGTTWTFDVTPRAEALVSLDIPAGIAFDSAGNGNTALADTYDYTYNSIKIAVNFTSSSSPVTNDATVTITIAFDLDMDQDDLAVGELSINGGSLSNFQKISDDVYTVDIVSMTTGTITLTVADGAASRTEGRTNPESSFSFTYDGDGPALPLFDVLEFSSRDVLFSDDAANEILEIDLTTDYSGDTGLTFEYTIDNGATWLGYTDPRYIAAEGLYSGINIRVTDGAGNVSEGTAVTNVTIDSTPPDSPIVNILTDPVNASNYTDFSFALSGGEADITYNYTLSSSMGGTDVTGSGSLDGSGEVSVSGLDTTSLNDGTLTLQVRLTDEAGNQSGIGQDQVERDIIAPSAPVVTINSSDPVTSADNDSFSFSVTGGEEGAAYSYTISSDSGGAVLSGSGTFDSTGDFSESNINVEALPDGNLTVSIVQTDNAENQSAAGSDTVVLNAKAFNDSDFSQAVDATNVGSYSFSIFGDPDSTYSYTLSSSNGGASLSDSGLIPAGGEEAIGPLDLSAMNDGWLILIVSVTDTLGNSSIKVFVAEKSSVLPDTGTADFSAATMSVTFDMSFHGSQTVPDRSGGSGTEVVKFDTADFAGSAFDDVIKFTDLSDGETFAIAGGGGFNTIDLSDHPASAITITSGILGDAGQANNGSVMIDLGGGESAAINFTDVQYFEFNSKVFDGSPHALILDNIDDNAYYFDGSANSIIVDDNGLSDAFSPAIPIYQGSLQKNFNLGLSVQMITGTRSQNASLVFDYVDHGNFKFIEAGAGGDIWRIRELVNGTASANLATFVETLESGDDYATTPVYSLELRVTGEDGDVAEIWSAGEMKTSYDFNEPLNDGLFGVNTRNAQSKMTLNLEPSNWAPYVKKYDVKISQSAGNTVTLDLLGDALDQEDEPLILTALSSGSGTLSDNGDGTVTYQVPGPSFYGIDEFTYQVSDGTNISTGTIRFDVVP
ncbi:Ig-like domain-containing protein [Spirochaeta isovalerica]|uniref:Cadherin domain-containing protein n=1 Tax=Spirochaeta isovalerica TaxID=150 RepID=A0A841R9Q3_9SPIO|nr:hypothetical protein [Spirochaeta isovalerica]